MDFPKFLKSFLIKKDKPLWLYLKHRRSQISQAVLLVTFEDRCPFFVYVEAARVRLVLQQVCVCQVVVMVVVGGGLLTKHSKPVFLFPLNVNTFFTDTQSFPWSLTAVAVANNFSPAFSLLSFLFAFLFHFCLPHIYLPPYLTLPSCL